MHIFFYSAVFELAMAAICLAFAPQISMAEKKFKDRHPWARLSGWSGTPKGIWSWRIIGLLLIFLAAMSQAFGFLLLGLR